MGRPGYSRGSTKVCNADADVDVEVDVSMLPESTTAMPLPTGSTKQGVRHKDICVYLLRYLRSHFHSGSYFMKWLNRVPRYQREK